MNDLAEGSVQSMIRCNAPSHGCILMRNNAGSYKDINGRAVRFGLGNISKKHNDKIKSSDLIGFTTIVVTPEMVGTTVAVFTAIEVKRGDWVRSLGDAHQNAQAAFMDWIKAKGGLAGFAWDWDSFCKILGK